ncbi:aldehyde dehydrogenase family protein [Streptomyces sp. NPDC020766]|uniref:aldehyde dehydrogenase family protein n=1 Tax=Streptomyces sp. NPDC020766 TaxID=3155011 RepID=UPI0033E4CEC5
MSTSEQLVLAGTRMPSADGKTFTVYEPATGAALAEVAYASVEDVDRAVAAAVTAQESWADWTPSARAAVLHRWADLVEARAEELAVLQTRENGLTIRESRGMLWATSALLRYSADAVDKIVGETIPNDAGGLLMTQREPLGVVAAITAWNGPIAMAAQKAGPALVTGNTVVLKPSELAPLTSLIFGDLASEAGLPEGCLSILPGDGSVGRALVENRDVARVTFTGSTATGQDIARRAASTFKRLTLELGGKSAAIVFADADLDRVCAVAPEAMFGLAGQDCCARSRLLIHESVYDQVVEGYSRTSARLKVGDPLDETTDLGPLISVAHRDRVHGFVEESVADGAVAVTGGAKPTGLPEGGGWYVPTVLTGVRSDMRVAQEEVFGPVVSVIPFATEEEAIRLANDTRYGLSGSIWTGNIARAIRVSRKVKSGVLAVNSNTSNYLQAPFGGVKQSGIGRANGLAGLEANTELKTLFMDGT